MLRLVGAKSQRQDLHQHQPLKSSRSSSTGVPLRCLRQLDVVQVPNSRTLGLPVPTWSSVSQAQGVLPRSMGANLEAFRLLSGVLPLQYPKCFHPRGTTTDRARKLQHGCGGEGPQRYPGPDCFLNFYLRVLNV
jgi:hypothetical protein